MEGRPRKVPQKSFGARACPARQLLASRTPICELDLRQHTSFKPQTWHSKSRSESSKVHTKSLGYVHCISSLTFLSLWQSCNSNTPTTRRTSKTSRARLETWSPKPKSTSWFSQTPFPLFLNTLLRLRSRSPRHGGDGMTARLVIRSPLP